MKMVPRSNEEGGGTDRCVGFGGASSFASMSSNRSSTLTVSCGVMIGVLVAAVVVVVVVVCGWSSCGWSSCTRGWASTTWQRVWVLEAAHVGAIKESCSAGACAQALALGGWPLLLDKLASVGFV